MGNTIIFYRPHAATEVYPNRTHIDLAVELDVHYVTASIRNPDGYELRNYRIIDDVVTEKPITVHYTCNKH